MDETDEGVLEGAVAMGPDMGGEDSETDAILKLIQREREELKNREQ